MVNIVKYDTHTFTIHLRKWSYSVVCPVKTVADLLATIKLTYKSTCFEPHYMLLERKFHLMRLL